jgi:hypothetical protein
MIARKKNPWDGIPYFPEGTPGDAQFQEAMQEMRIAKLGLYLGWRNVMVEEQNGERFLTGISPETGKKEILPSLEELQRTIVKGG